VFSSFCPEKISKFKENFMLVSKLNTLRKIYKSRGIAGLLKTTLSKIFRRTYNFNRVAREVTSHLSEPTSLEVYKRLSEGVYYIFGMGVEGDIAEFGTMSGRTAVALAAALNYCNKTLSDSDLRHGFKEPRKLWLFDSFEGLPQARTNVDQSSLHVASGIWGGVHV
jgi:hypothetical protein